MTKINLKGENHYIMGIIKNNLNTILAILLFFIVNFIAIIIGKIILLSPTFFRMITQLFY